MKLPNDVKFEQVMNDDQVMFRNPSLVNKTDGVDTQQELVDKLRTEKKDSGEVTFEYTEESKPWHFPGFTKIRELDERQLTGLFNTVMRFKPNIIQFHVRLGHYPNKKSLSSSRLNECGANKPRWPKEIAPKFAAVFADPSKRVVEFIYTVDSATEGQFRAHAEAFYVSAEEYEDDKAFKPAVGIRYFVPSTTF
jgi:hypothetical protein